MSKRIAYKGPKRVDANHALIRNEFESRGATVMDTHELPGELDMVVGYWGRDVRVEVKDGEKPKSRRKLTDAERATFAEWRGRPCEVVESVGDVDRVLRSIREDVLCESRGKRSRA